MWEDGEYGGGYLNNPKYEAAGRYYYCMLSNAEPRYNSEYSIRHDALHTNPGTDYINAFGQTLNAGTRYGLTIQLKDNRQVVFASMWIKAVAPFGMDDPHDQAKLIGVKFSNTAKTWVHIDGAPDVTDPPGWVMGTHILKAHRESSTEMMHEGVWGRIDFFLDRSNDVFRVWYDGKLIRDDVHIDDLEIDHVRILQYVRNDTSGAISFLTDDHYFNFTQARVELGNAATFEAADHREIQLPLNWEEGRIEIRVNQGSFSSGEQVYLFVVNSAGQVSPGYGPIPFGTSNTSPPAAPTHLQVD